MALGVDNFCWHHWEEPAYNKALNLREGLEVCSKCGSVKGFTRWVPREYENLGLKPPAGPVVDLVSIATAVLLLFIAIAVGSTLVPILNAQVARIAGESGVAGTPAASILKEAPWIMFIGAMIAFVGAVFSAFRPLMSGSEEGSKVLNGDDEYEP